MLDLVGGAQAIAALALGTESIIKVDKIFGPGIVMSPKPNNRSALFQQARQ